MNQTEKDTQARDKRKPPQPVDVFNGIPDCGKRFRWGLFVVLITVFILWVAFLFYCQWGGKITT